MWKVHGWFPVPETGQGGAIAGTCGIAGEGRREEGNECARRGCWGRIREIEGKRVRSRNFSSRIRITRDYRYAESTSAETAPPTGNFSVPGQNHRYHLTPGEFQLFLPPDRY